MEPLDLMSFMNTGGGSSMSGMASMFSLGAAGFDLVGAGFQAYGDIVQSEGVAAGDQFQAEQAQVAGKYAGLQAVQVGGQMTRNLNTTLGNISAIRAAARTDPTSPTGAAVYNREEEIGTEERGIKVGNLLAQQQQDEADAAYYRSAASTALLSGDISAFADVAKGVGSAASAIALPLLLA